MTAMRRTLALAAALAAQVSIGADPTWNGITYSVTSNAVTIRAWPSATNSVEVPAEIDGTPVRSIGPRAFAGRRGLLRVSIPDSVLEVGDEAFLNCYDLAGVMFGKSVTNIGKAAFSYCVALDGITLPHGLLRIGPGAFMRSGISRLTLPVSLRELGDRAFAECNRLKDVTLAGGDGIFTVQDQVLFDRNQTTLLLYPAGRPGAAYTIPESVTCVGAGAFTGCTNLTRLTIGSRVTNLCAEAFYRCAGLQRVTIPDSVVKLGDAVFCQCGSLAEVTLGANLDRIEMAVFRNCPSLQSIRIPDGVKEIAAYAFESSGLTNVTLGRNLRKIGPRAFGTCARLREIQLPQGVEEIGEDAFMHCAELRRVVLPASVKTIGADPFFCSRALSEIVVEEGNTAFRSVDGVLYDGAMKTLLHYPLARGGSEYRIPEGVTTVNRHAFLMVKSLTNIVFPASLIRIGESAFAGAENIRRLDFPDALTVVDRNAFATCQAVTDVPSLGQVSSLAPDTFRSCESLVRVALPAGLTGIGVNAFQRTALARIVIPPGVRKIDQGAFSQCGQLRDVLFDGDAPVIQASAFQSSPARLFYRQEAKGWTHGMVAGCPVLCMDAGTGVAYAPQVDGTAAVAGYLGTDSVLRIPATLGGRPVTAIQEGAFAGNVVLEACWLPPGLTSLATRVFAGCTNLTSVIMEGSAPQAGTGLFEGVPTMVYYPSGATGWSETFAGRPARASLIGAGMAFTASANGSIEILRYFGTNRTAVVPAEIDGKPVEAIAVNAFAGRRDLAGVAIHASVRRIGKRAFDGCYRLAVVDGAGGVTDVGFAAFDSCYALTNAVVAGAKVGGAAVAEEDRAGRLALRLYLTKGDRITGTNAMRSVLFRMDGATLVVPLAHITEIRMGAGEAADSVRLRSGAVLEGKVDLQHLGLMTEYASLVVDLRSILTLQVLRDASVGRD